MNFLQKLFKKEPITITEEPKKFLKEKNLNDISQFDDVWIKINDTICDGWVVQRTSDIIEVVFTTPDNKLADTKFKIERPLDRDFLIQNNKILFLTKKAAELQ